MHLVAVSNLAANGEAEPTPGLEFEKGGFSRFLLGRVVAGEHYT